MLGRGGMGEVYLAEHLVLEKLVALKILPPSRVDADAVARFLREARLCSRIEHPNVVPVYDAGESGDLHYFVMQYVEGNNLAELISERGSPLPWPAAVKIIRDAAQGLAAVHRLGLLHRDVKPQNIMVSKDSRVLLMDFGLAREQAHSDLTASGNIVGTLAFMSPEQSEGTHLDKRTDIYSLGATLHYLVTGKRLGAQIAIFRGQPVVAWLDSAVPEPVKDLIVKATAFSPRDRYATADDFITAIDSLLPADQSTIDWHDGKPEDVSAISSRSSSEARVVVPAGTRPSTRIPVGKSFAIAFALTIATFAFVGFPLRHTYIGAMLVQRGLMPYLISLAFLWGLSIVILRYSSTRRSLRWPKELQLFLKSQEQITSRNVSEHRAKLRSLSGNDATAASRINDALERFEVSHSVPDVENFLTNQALLDTAAITKRSRLLQAMIWACPLLGLLGTVSGFIEAATGLQYVMPQKQEMIEPAEANGAQQPGRLLQVLAVIAQGVATAFDTLLFGIVTGILLWIVSSVLQEREVRATEASSAVLLQRLLAKLRSSE